MAPDVYVFVVDNFVETKKIKVAVAAGVNVALFFSMYYDPQNTMDSEIKTIDELRERMKESCVCIDYKNDSEFEQRFTGYLDSSVTW